MPVQELARKVAATLPDDKFKFDPTIILVIMELIMEMLPILMELCNQTPEEVVTMADNPTRLQRRVLRLRTRRTLGRKAFREMGEDIVTGLIKVTKEAKPAEIEDAYNEADC